MALFGRAQIMGGRQTTAAWTPLSAIATVYRWWDADDISTFTFSSGSIISTWTDKKNSVALTGGGSVERVASVINGRAVVRFDGVDDEVTTSNSFAAATTPLECWVVVRSDESGIGAVWSEGHTTMATLAYRLYDDDTPNDYVFNYQNNSGTNRFANAQDRSTNDWDLVIASELGIAVGTNLEVVDVDAGTTGAWTRDAFVTNRFNLGVCERSAKSLWFDGDIAEIWFCAPMGSTDRANATAYLNAKYGKSWTPA